MHNIEQEKVHKGKCITLLSEKDLNVSYFCGSGAGGQARNKVASGVQIRHEESGAMGRASDSRSQADNKRRAFERMIATPQMKFWLSKRLYEVRMEETLEETVARECAGGALRHEIKNAAGQWEAVPESYFDTPAAIEE